MKYLIAVLLTVSVLSCSLNGTHSYTVKAGKHEMKGNRVKPIKQNSFNYVIQTNDSWTWPVPEQNGFSKVTGIRWIIGEVENSARLVYIVKEQGAEFWAYFYVKGTSPQENKDYKRYLCDVEPGKSYYGSVGNENGYMFVRVDGEQHSVKCSGEGLSFLCFPYIGGRYTISHDWRVKITYL